jgi:hypothetical protein
VWTAKAESARSADEAFIEAFEEPICMFLRDRSIGQSLLNTVTHFRCLRGLDRVLYILNIYASLSCQFLKRLSTPQRVDQFIGCHIERFGGGLQTLQPKAATAARTASPMQWQVCTTLRIRAGRAHNTHYQ